MDNNLGKYIQNYRKKHGLSLRNFAEICDLSHSYIDKLEKGIDPRNNKPILPTIDTLEKIARATNTSLKDLLVSLEYINDDYDFDKVNKLLVSFIEGMERKGVNLKEEPLENILDKILLAAELLNKAKESR